MKENTGAIHAQMPVDVATFLLNEKRQDIHKIEMRFKVNVLLIPNIHLETPNYEMERLRSDSEKLELATPSYEMVNRPVEEVTAKAAEVESKPSRPEPLVKGITPAQPAPMAADPLPERHRATAVGQPAIPAPSLWKRFMNMFSAEPAPASQPIAEARPAKRDARNDRGERNERGGRGGRGGGGDGDRKRGERKERSPQPGQERGDRNDRPPRNDGRKPNESRADRAVEAKEPRGPETPTQKPRQQQPNKPALEARPLEAGEEGEGRGRRRRGRGGRGGRDGREGREEHGGTTPAASPLNAQQPAAPAIPAAPAAAVAQAEFAMPALSQADGNAAVSTAAVNSASVAAVVSAQDPAPGTVPAAGDTPHVTSERVALAAVPVPAAVRAPITTAPSFTPAAPAPVDQIADDQPSVPRQPRQRPRQSESNMDSAPLVFIETAADKLQSVAATVQEEEAPRHRTPRPRKPRDIVNEPLVFVETQPVSKPDQTTL